MQADEPKTVVAGGHLFSLTDVIGWCAGNEARSVYFYIPWKIDCLRLLIDIWKSMVADFPIDDQREMRSGDRVEVKAEQVAESSSVRQTSG